MYYWIFYIFFCSTPLKTSKSCVYAYCEMKKTHLWGLKLLLFFVVVGTISQDWNFTQLKKNSPFYLHTPNAHVSTFSIFLLFTYLRKLIELNAWRAIREGRLQQQICDVRGNVLWNLHKFNLIEIQFHLEQILSWYVIELRAPGKKSLENSTFFVLWTLCTYEFPLKFLFNLFEAMKVNYNLCFIWCGCCSVGVLTAHVIIH